MTRVQKLVLELIKFELTGINVSNSLLKDINADVLDSVYDISVEQGVSAIVGSALFKLDVLDEDSKLKFFNEQIKSIYVVEEYNYELERIIDLFEKEKIEFIPLKGSVLRKYYPKPEYRESCDIDVLIHSDDLERACDALKREYGYEQRTSCCHDVGLFSKNGVELELHFILYSTYNSMKTILDRVWDYAVPCSKDSYEHKLENEFFIAYHLIHMYKHVVSGGCGVKPFVDLKVIEDKFEYDHKKLNTLIEKAEITRFAEKVFDLSRYWFANGKYEETLELFEEYIFDAGAYGSLENQVAVSLAQNGSKFKNLLDRIFMPYDKLRVTYPKLNSKPYLLPFYEVKRWMRIIFKDKMKHQLAIMKHNSNIDDEKKEKTTRLMENLGLNEHR